MNGFCVVDSSVGIGWIHPSQATELTKHLLEEAKNGNVFHVPALWHLEIANGLLVAVRRKLMIAAQRELGLAFLSQLQIVIDDESNRLSFSTISEFAIENSLSVYDAAYLELARRKLLPLGTRDEPLKAAAKKSGVKLL